MCDDCEGRFNNEDIDYYAGVGRRLCESCASDYPECERCEATVRETQSVYVDEHTSEEWCDDCVEFNAFYCSECERYYAANCMSETDSSLCEYCNPSNQEQLTGEISNWRAPRGVLSYSYRPAPCFLPYFDAATIYYGFELEIESHGNDCGEAANRINNTLGYTYAKHDGSLSDGLEIVSHPATLEYHLSKKAVYKELFEALRKDGFRSHSDGTCGLHVHISLKAMEAANPFAVHNMLILYDRFWDNFVKLSRRRPRQLSDWARRYAAKDERYELVKEMAKNERSRYMAVNLQNEFTVEIRMWRGTLIVDTFLATLQLVDLITRRSIEIGRDALRVQTITWEELTASPQEELRAYLDRCGLLNAAEAADTEVLEEREALEVSAASNPFAVGDRVTVQFPEHIGDYDYANSLAGYTATGTVLTVFSGCNAICAIGFDEPRSEFHSASGGVDFYHGYNIATEHITRIEEPQPQRFEVGCRVADHRGRTATIRHIESAYGILIEYDEGQGFTGHNGNGRGPVLNSNRGWWVEERDIHTI